MNTTLLCHLFTGPKFKGLDIDSFLKSQPPREKQQNGVPLKNGRLVFLQPQDLSVQNFNLHFITPHYSPDNKMVKVTTQPLHNKVN